MTRHDLEQAICDLQYLIVNRFDPDRIEQYGERLHQLRCQLRALQQSETSAVGQAATAPLSHKASSSGI